MTSEDLEALYFLETRLIPLTTAFSSLYEVIKGLRRVLACHTLDTIAEPSTGSTNDEEPFESEESDIMSYIRNLNSLLKRRSSTVELINTTLSLRNQRSFSMQTSLLVQLGSYALEDSASIHVITVITLIFLPFTGVAVRQTTVLYSQILRPLIMTIDFTGHAFLLPGQE